MDDKRKDYTYRSIREERKYGFYWYSGLWRVIRPILVGLTVFVVVAGLLVTGYNKVYAEFFAPMDAEDHGEVPFDIASGQSLTRVANNLEKAGLIHSRTVFKYYCDFAGMGQKIQAGSYLLSKSMSMMEIADKLTTGDGNPIVRNVTLIPGETIESFADKLLSNGTITDKDDFLAKCRTGTDYKNYYYIDEILSSGTAKSRRYVLEGYLAPETYEMYTNATNDDIIKKLLSQTEAAFTETMEQRAEELGMTRDQVLTLASMIEKEAKTADFAKVSAVFHNRLKAGMKLESDATVNYVTGRNILAIPDSDLRTASPYNTYMNSGLPVGPICSPSKAAITAALYPDETLTAENYLYFCNKDPETGELHFSKTLEEHNKAVELYRPLWIKHDEAAGKKQ